jgi:hypothetical protein
MSTENNANEKTDDSTDYRKPDMPTPRETKEDLADVSALVTAKSHAEKRLEVTGRGRGGEPEVSVTFPSQVEGEFDTSSFTFTLPADRARDLAEALERRAEYAEEYARRAEELQDPDA